MTPWQSDKLVKIVYFLLFLTISLHAGKNNMQIVRLMMQPDNNAHIRSLGESQEFAREYISLFTAYEPQNGNKERRKKYTTLKKQMLLKYHPDKYPLGQKEQIERLAQALNSLINDIENRKDDTVFMYPEILIPTMYFGLMYHVHASHLYAGFIAGRSIAPHTLGAFNSVFNYLPNAQNVTSSFKLSFNNLDKIFSQMTPDQQRRYQQQRQRLAQILK